MLKAVFAPFGQVININIQRESNGTSKGYGFIEVSLQYTCNWLTGNSGVCNYLAHVSHLCSNNNLLIH